MTPPKRTKTPPPSIHLLSASPPALGANRGLIPPHGSSGGGSLCPGAPWAPPACLKAAALRCASGEPTGGGPGRSPQAVGFGVLRLRGSALLWLRLRARGTGPGARGARMEARYSGCLPRTRLQLKPETSAGEAGTVPAVQPGRGRAVGWEQTGSRPAACAHVAPGLASPLTSPPRQPFASEARADSREPSSATGAQYSDLHFLRRPPASPRVPRRNVGGSPPT